MEKMLGGVDQLSTISIVGIPGIGKTTLARKLYNHENIVNRIDVRSWCCVSEIYDKKNLLLELLGYAFDQYHVDQIERSEDELTLQVQKCLEKRRYLIVIDDVCKSTSIWDDLVKFFPDDNKRSRIIVTTTRLDDELPVNLFCNSTIYRLSFLAEDKGWLLLQKTIFKEDVSCPKELEEIGKQIVAKGCAGLPLAIMLIGGLLARLNMKKSYWTKVAEWLISTTKVAGEAEWYMDIIELNYKNSPHYLKPCFLYFGMFLKDEEVSVKKLIRLWVAEGFVESNEMKMPEHVAMDYLIDLVTSNLVTVTQKFPLGDIKTVRLHRLVLDFCLAKAKKENFLGTVDSSHEFDPTTNSASDNIHQFLISSKMHHFMIKWLHPTQRIHTLRLYAHSSNEFSLPDGAFHSDLFKSVTVMDLENIVIEASALEDIITFLIHLKYLAIFGNFSEIPPAISNLTNLETLVARPKSGTLSLPGSLWDMINLKHVDTSEGMIHFKENAHSERLEKLESLSKLVVVNGNDISELCKRAPNLIQLELITVEHCDSLFSFLNSLIYLEILVVYHSSDLPMSTGISNMVFPQSLKELTLSSCGFSWDEISTVGRLPNLEVLNILVFAFSGRKWTVGVGGFLNLRLLKIEHNSIKHWNISSVDTFPCLEQLVLRWCDQLEEIPSSFGYMPSLQKIEVHSRCHPAMKSAVKIRNMQRDVMGNSDFKVIISLD